MNIKEVEEKSSGSGHATTLYNFGYAAMEVIEQFQRFCYNYCTLEKAIFALLNRDKLLIQKYRFIRTPITYQMLARPTEFDKPNCVRSAMLAVHKYTKEGKYKSVADAIEELLFGPECSKSFKHAGVNTNDTFSFGYTAINEVEKEALLKITDVLMLRLSHLGSQEKQTKKRVRKSISNKNLPKVSFVSPIKETTATKKTEIEVHNISSQKVPSKPAIEDFDYAPSAKKKVMLKSTATDVKEISLLQNPTIEYNTEPIDIEMLTPLERLTPQYKIPCKTQAVIKNTCLSGPCPSEKELFMLNHVNLISPFALDISSKTSSFVVNLDELDY